MVGAQQDDVPGLDAFPTGTLPGPNIRRLDGHAALFGAQIDHDARPDQAVDGQLVHVAQAGKEMIGRVHVGARVRHEVQDFHVGHVASGLREHGLEARVGETWEDRDARS